MSIPESVIGYRFRDAALLKQALTHRSAGDRNNERLEFLGDAALSFVAASMLYQQFPGASEGDLSRYRARLVSGATLAEIAIEHSIGDIVILGAGELKSGGFRRWSILADTLEAILGAIYLDGGVEAANEAIRALIRPRVESLPPASELKDPKTRLQELLQGRQLNLPEYELIEATGADHARRFLVSCRVAALEAETQGQGTSRRKAEQDAATAMLKVLA